MRSTIRHAGHHPTRVVYVLSKMLYVSNLVVFIVLYDIIFQMDIYFVSIQKNKKLLCPICLPLAGLSSKVCC
jgi:hypothetical protein